VVEVGPLTLFESRPYADLAGLPDLAYFPAASSSDRLIAVGAHISSLPVGVAVVALLGEGCARLMAFKLRAEYDAPDTNLRVFHELESALASRGCSIVDYAYYRELHRQVSFTTVTPDDNPVFRAAGWSAGQPASIAGCA
jgi:hypothetical protein